MSTGQGRVRNQETDKRVKYNFDTTKVAKAMGAAGVDEHTHLHPGSEHGLAKDVVNNLGLDGDDLNVRRGVERFIARAGITPKK